MRTISKVTKAGFAPLERRSLFRKGEMDHKQCV
jgi:hypothetical protein